MFSFCPCSFGSLFDFFSRIICRTEKLVRFNTAIQQKNKTSKQRGILINISNLFYRVSNKYNFGTRSLKYLSTQTILWIFLRHHASEIFLCPVGIWHVKVSQRLWQYGTGWSNTEVQLCQQVQKAQGNTKTRQWQNLLCVQEWQITWRIRIWENRMKVPHIIYFYILPQTAGHHHPKEGSHQNPKRALWKDSGIWGNENTSCNSLTGNRLLKFKQDC